MTDTKRDVYFVRNKVVYPENLAYFCPAFPYRRGYITINIRGDNYKMFSIKPGKTFELVYPKSKVDSFIPTCVLQYIGPDLVLVNEHVYTNYIRLI